MKKITLTLLAAATTFGGASIHAGPTNETYRTTAYFYGITQGTNSSFLGDRPVFDSFDFAGHNLVNLAMGRALNDKSNSSQVLAMTFACDLSSASLVVYDAKASNVIADIADSTTIDSVRQQDPRQKGPNHAHFVGVFQLSANGNPTNGIAGGYFTIAGRVNLNTVTGCPLPVRVNLDHDNFDLPDGEIELSAKLDPDNTPFNLRTGLAHAIGVVDAVTNGRTNTALVPVGRFSIRRELSGPAPVVSPSAN